MTVTLAASDDDGGSGVARIAYALTGAQTAEATVAGAEASVAVKPGHERHRRLLRAERAGAGTGRVYTLTYAGRDGAGNESTCTTTVTVPHEGR